MEGLKLVLPSEIQGLKIDPVDPVARDDASRILLLVKNNGLTGLLDTAVRLGDLENLDSKYFYTKDDLYNAFLQNDINTQEVLTRTAERIKIFAVAQRSSINELTIPIPGGQAGHNIAPVEVAGCYAPGGRYPLPSSVLMTVLTARAAGVKTVWAASPRPALATLAAAYIAGADGLLAIGGAQAIAAMAYGIGPISACDVIVGPGNKWVTAAKSLIAGVCAIDMLAGPSEVLIIADKISNSDIIAADLLAQAEHDVEARPILVCTDIQIAYNVNDALVSRLKTLPTASTAIESVKKGFACICPDLDTAIQVANVIGPEHLEIHIK
jgi:phosphoribosyl-ATP pyrophosphohydrolase/phosphoribosyl-AMP cyclohydrolase/histidinol dehydrogenase